MVHLDQLNHPLASGVNWGVREGTTSQRHGVCDYIKGMSTEVLNDI